MTRYAMSASCEYVEDPSIELDDEDELLSRCASKVINAAEGAMTEHDDDENSLLDHECLLEQIHEQRRANLDVTTEVADILKSLDQFTLSSQKVFPTKQHNNHISEATTQHSVFTSVENEPGREPAQVPVSRHHQPLSFVEIHQQHANDILREAEEIREQARVWAAEVRAAVHDWLQRHESTLQSQQQSLAQQQQQQLLRQRVVDLENQMRESLTHYRKTELRMHEIILEQQRQILELEKRSSTFSRSRANPQSSPESELQEGRVLKHAATSDVKTLPSSLEDEEAEDNDSLEQTSHEPETLPKHAQEQVPHPSTVAHDPYEQIDPESAENYLLHQNRKIQESAVPASGVRVIKYNNGSVKEIHPDGTTAIYFANGDIETRDSFGIIAYHFANSQVLQVRHADGSMQLEYPDGQTERHWPDGRKIIKFPNGVVRRWFPSRNEKPSTLHIERERSRTQNSEGVNNRTALRMKTRQTMLSQPAPLFW